MKREQRSMDADGLSRRGFLGRTAAGVVGLSLGGASLERLSAAERAGGVRSVAGRNSHYPSNRDPLAPSAYAPLPLGSVSPRGWLRHQLEGLAEGITGRLDEVWPDVGPDNGWRGGGGDPWERGPYWLDGLVPLAHTLGDERLIEKARPWIEWSLSSQRKDGFFGPGAVERKQRQGSVQNGADWWPRMIMLKVLQQHHEATGDERVPELMTRYFRYQQRRLPDNPLDHWSFWGQRRGGENEASILWLYNRTGDRSLLDVAQTVFEQTHDWTGKFTEDHGIWHVVNTAMGIKQPGVHYQLARDDRYLEAVGRGIDYLMDRHGQIGGLWSGDELLHGTNPVQGTETCAVVEYMYSLETLLPITGNPAYADRLERVAFNALPASLHPEFTGRHYYQTANQIECTSEPHNFSTRHGDDNVMGLETGYGCCTANLHQGWPKFTAHLWLATPDDGLAALVYAPSEVTAKVADGTEVTVREETEYPFDETIRLTLSAPDRVRFPLHLRIPSWAEGATVRVNGRARDGVEPGGIVRIDREWADGDRVELHFPMRVRTSRWHERSAGVERGPLVYALQLDEEWTPIDDGGPYGDYEVRTDDDWNYGLLRDAVRNPDGAFEVTRRPVRGQPWSPDGAPVEITAAAKRVEQWRPYLAMTGPLPWSPLRSDAPTREVRLVPYGATTLRISAFPVVR